MRVVAKPVLSNSKHTGEGAVFGFVAITRDDGDPT
jgi:hypothetical protein